MRAEEFRELLEGVIGGNTKSFAGGSVKDLTTRIAYACLNYNATEEFKGSNSSSYKGMYVHLEHVYRYLATIQSGSEELKKLVCK